MPIEISDLPPQYRAQILAKAAKQDAGRGKTQHKSDAPPAALLKKIVPPKQNKYRNNPAMRISPNGKPIMFQSTKEAERYDYLLMRLKGGQIRKLRLQADFTLQEAYTDENGNRVRAIRYSADFAYEERFDSISNGVPNSIWRPVIEDVKSRGTRTDKYQIKKKMLKNKFGIDITEV